MAKIRICTLSDISKVQSFIDQKWRAGHILSHNIELLKWQHLDSVNNHLNYIVAEREVDNQIIAIFGFIPTSQFDKSLLDEKDFWLAIWKIDTDIAPPGIGMLLYDFFVNTYQPKSIGAIGINDKIARLYKFLGYKPGAFNQYYYLNPKKETFHIARIEKIGKSENKSISNQTIKELEAVTDLPPNSHRPLKTIEYLKNRYMLHPSYKYRYFAVNNDHTCLAIFVIRKINIEGSSCLRIIDILGSIEHIDNLGLHFNTLLQSENSEYIDCLNGGIPEHYFYKLGFSKRDDKIIIPNYFEPFEKHNVDIKYAYKSSYEPYIIFKGDSDQDRPNI